MRITDAAAVEGVNKALAHGGATHSYSDVLNRISCGRAQLWEGENAILVSEIHNMPLKRVLHFWLATGTLADVVRLSDDALAWAKSLGISEATMTGRRGWERALADKGWKPMLTTMGREI